MMGIQRPRNAPTDSTVSIPEHIFCLLLMNSSKYSTFVKLTAVAKTLKKKL